MAEYQTVIENISRLRSMIPGDLSERTNFKSIWSQIKVVGNSFKGARFPNPEQHQKAWGEFQQLVDNVKNLQEEDQENWERRKIRSGELRNKIINQAHTAKPPSEMFEGILSMLTGGISSVLSEIMGPFDDRKRDLQRCNEWLKEGWDTLNSNKDEMLGKDKQAAFSALNETKDRLDEAWAKYKQERDKAWEAHQHAKNEKQNAWRARTMENIRNLEERKHKLQNVLSHKVSHLSELQSKYAEAWSDDYRDRISGWIDEETDSIRDIQNKLSEVESWIHEAEVKLN